MSSPTPTLTGSKITHLEAGDTVSPSTVSAVTRQLEQRLIEMQDLILAMASGTQTFQVAQVQFSNQVTQYSVVYLDGSSNTYKPALARVDSGSTPANPMSKVQGVCVSLDNSFVGDIAYAGVVTQANAAAMLETGDTWKPGTPYYLSDREAGKITSRNVPFKVLIGQATTDGFLIGLNTTLPQIDQTTQRVSLGMRPAGGLRRIHGRSTAQRVVAYDGIEKVGSDWVSTKDSENPTIAANGFVKAEVTPVRSTYLQEETIIVIHRPKNDPDAVSVVQAASLEDYANEVFLKEDYNLSHDGTHTITLANSAGETLGTLDLAFIDADGLTEPASSNERYAVLEYPKSFIGWKNTQPALPTTEIETWMAENDEGDTFVEGQLKTLSDYHPGAVAPLIDQLSNNSTLDHDLESTNLERLVMVKCDKTIPGPNSSNIQDASNVISFTGSLSNIPVVTKYRDQFLVVSLTSAQYSTLVSNNPSAASVAIVTESSTQSVNLATYGGTLKLWHVLRSNLTVPSSCLNGYFYLTHPTTGVSLAGSLSTQEEEELRVWAVLGDRFFAITAKVDTQLPEGTRLAVRKPPAFFYTTFNDRAFSEAWSGNNPFDSFFNMNGVELVSGKADNLARRLSPPNPDIGFAAETLYWVSEFGESSPWDFDHTILAPLADVEVDGQRETLTVSGVDIGGLWEPAATRNAATNQGNLYINAISKKLRSGAVRSLEVTSPLKLTTVEGGRSDGTGHLHLSLTSTASIQPRVGVGPLWKHGGSIPLFTNNTAEAFAITEVIVLLNNQEGMADETLGFVPAVFSLGKEGGYNANLAAGRADFQVGVSGGLYKRGQALTIRPMNSRTHTLDPGESFYLTVTKGCVIKRSDGSDGFQNISAYVIGHPVTSV
jgi:hypothetical protein